MMQREVAAIVLCILAQAASAQCVATPTVATAETHAVPVSETVRAAGTPATPAKAKPVRAELIKTAAAGTRDEDDDAPPAMTARAHANRQDHPRRGGTAMLLAALALMSGIALRRYGAPHA